MKKVTYLSVIFTLMLLLVGCRDNNSSNTTTITAVDGYIKDANFTDDVGQIGVYTSKGKYSFSLPLIYPLHLNGGVLEDTEASFDIEMILEDGSIISPITTFIYNNSSLQTKLAIALSISDTLDSFSIDYIEENNADLAKLSQLLYAIQKDENLLNAFKIDLSAGIPANLDDIFTLAEGTINSTMGDYAQSYNNFLNKVKSLGGVVSDYETNLETEKALLGYIYHNENVYKTVTSPYTGKVWLDRNLGAKNVCTSFDDMECYGDYYQWGRNYDGHQLLTSEINSTLATDIYNVGSSFIINTATNMDWVIDGIDNDGSFRITNWRKNDGSFICPINYRVPTINELYLETIAQGVINNLTAFDNFLKLPVSGSRSYSGNVESQNSIGFIWSSSKNSDLNESYFLRFDSTIATTEESNVRAFAYSIRCIQNSAPITEEQNIIVNADSSNNEITLFASDLENDTLTFTILSQPTHGTLSGTAPNLTYTPDSGYIGDDIFTYKVNDGRIDSLSATISISVLEVVASNVALNKVVSALTNTVTGDPQNITDGDPDNVWYSFEYQDGGYVLSFIIDFEEIYSIEKYSFQPWQIREYTIESSLDGVTWTIQHDISGLNYYDPGLQEIDISTPYQARYIRYRSSNNDNGWTGMGEFEVYGVL